MTAQSSTAKKSFFLSYCGYKLRRNKNLLILSAIFSVLSIPVFTAVMSICIGIVNKTVASNSLDSVNVTGIFDKIDTISVAGSVIAALCALVVMLMTLVVVSSLFSYNLKKCDADMYLSLPLTADQRFFADLLTGGIISVLPMTVFGAISAVAAAVSNVGIDKRIEEMYNNDLSNGNVAYETPLFEFFSRTNNVLYRDLPKVILYAFIALTTVMIFMYLFCVLVNSVTGKSSDYIVFTIAFMAALTIIVPVLLNIPMQRVTNNMSTEETSSIIMFASPLGMAFSYLFSLMDEIYAEVLKVADDAGTMSLVQNDRYDMFSVFNTRNIMIMLLIFAICIVLAYLANRFRKAEKTGMHFAYEIPYHIITLGFIAAVLLSIFLFGTSYGSQNTIEIIVFVAISAVVYFFAELTHGRKFKKIWQSVLRYAVCVLGTFGLCFVLKNADIGLEHYIPNADGIKSIGITNSAVYNYATGKDIVDDYGLVTIEDKKAVDAILKYNSFLVNNGFAYPCGNYTYLDGFRENYDNKPLNVCYNMNDGRIITRSFMIRIDDQNYSEYAKALYDMRLEVSKTDEYTEKIVKTCSSFKNIIIHRKQDDLYGRRFDAKLCEKLITAIENDMKAGNNSGKLAAIIAFSDTEDSNREITLEIREGCSQTLALISDDANSVYLRQEAVDKVKAANESYRSSPDFAEEGGVGLEAVYIISKPYETDEGVFYDYDNTILITDELAQDELATELEKCMKLYDFYTDGLLADKEYIIAGSFDGAVYTVPNETSNRFTQLLETIAEKHGVKAPKAG